ncbi:HesA/MoeB/ThiF family protein [Lactiplantibacillus nangangensis]|uniref:HesA/MoeB/ThiF family protein n=1 Tax=Lactiplantibacillus nangangensis TaxID=2559917 RepID=A0ABW1SIA7_9LACO|nr:ThiF family adenylyltransferase [Lactiplantibacillus nangangensis]
MNFNKPMMKPMLIPFINEEHTGIRIGGFQARIARDIIVSNPQEFLGFLKDLNGENTLDILQQKYNLNSLQMNNLLQKLKECGAIYENNSKNFSEKEIRLYNRNINFFAWIDIVGKYYNYWDVQETLKKSKVLLLGAGGTGSNTALNLARLGFGTITIIDGDNVEESNLNRQTYSQADIGLSKVQVLKKHLESINPMIKIVQKKCWIDTLNDLTKLGSNFDILLDCIDKPENLPTILDKYCKETGTPWVLGGYASTVINHAIFDGSTVGFDELVKRDREKYLASREIFKNTFWKWDNAIISPIANISGSISSLYALYYVTSLKKLKMGIVQHIDFFNLQNLAYFSYILGDSQK